MELRELTPGLWRWTAAHPEWQEDFDWDEDVGCVAAVAPEALVLIDPLVADDGWGELDALVSQVGKPVATLLTVEWHARSSEAVRSRYGPWQGLLEGVERRTTGTSGFEETLFWLPEYATLVSGDLLTGTGGGRLRIAPASWFDENDEQRTWYREELPRIVAEAAELPVERVLTSHGEPVLSGGREALVAALP